MRILIILEEIPSEFRSMLIKGDTVTATIRTHKAAGFNIVLLPTGIEEKHNWEIINTLTFFQNLKSRMIRIFSNRGYYYYRSSCVSKSVEKYHQTKNIDIILANCLSGDQAIYAAFIKDQIGIPFVIREHRTIYQRARKSIDDIPTNIRLAFLKADKVLALTPQLANTMKSLGIRNDIECLPYAIPEEFFCKPKENGSFKEMGGNHFMFAGWTRWRDIKRLDLLIRAFSKVFEKRPDTRLVVAGSIETTKQQKTINNLISDLEIEPYVLLYGFATRQQIHQLAHSCDCCVISSDYETFGLPALEAIAAGKPVVATRCGGPESIITSELLGRIVEKGDSNLLAQAMLSIIDNIESFDGEYIKEIAHKRYSESFIKNQWKNVYKDIIKNVNPPLKKRNRLIVSRNKLKKTQTKKKEERERIGFMKVIDRGKYQKMGRLSKRLPVSMEKALMEVLNLFIRVFIDMKIIKPNSFGIFSPLFQYYKYKKLIIFYQETP